MKDALAVATIELLTAGEAWGENVERVQAGGGVGVASNAISLRARLCHAATAYSKARKAFDALKPACEHDAPASGLPVGFCSRCGMHVERKGGSWVAAARQSDGVTPPGLDDGPGSARLRHRSRDDGGFVPVVGAILCLGVTVAIFASCLWVLAWCPSCDSSAHGLFGGSWADGAGQEHFETQPDGSVLACRPILYVHNGYASATGAQKCGLVHVEASVNVPKGAEP